jgi:hypothetical protein
MRVLIALATSVLLTGCINSSTLIKVRPDGSGTVEQTTLVNMAAMKSMMPAGAANQPTGSVLSDEELKRAAERMGKGVRLVSSEPLKNGGWEGVKAIFSFDDINQVQVNQDPGGGAAGATPGQSGDNDPVKFKLVRNGASSMLTIAFQDKPGSLSPPSSGGTQPNMPDLSSPMIMNMIKTMFEGFKINISLEPVGTIVKTNAEYVTGSNITLLELDIAALLADEAKFKELQGRFGKDASLSQVKPYLKDIKGIKVDGPVITVEFK